MLFGNLISLVFKVILDGSDEWTGPRIESVSFGDLTVMDKVNTVVYKSGNWLKKGRLANHVFWTFLNLWISFLHFLHFPNTSTSHFCKNRPERKWHLDAPFVILEYRNVFFIHKMAPGIHEHIGHVVRRPADKTKISGLILSVVIEKLVYFEKTEKRNYNTRSKTFNVIFCVVIKIFRCNNSVHFISFWVLISAFRVCLIPTEEIFDEIEMIRVKSDRYSKLTIYLHV
jgi:hypothetical protein